MPEPSSTAEAHGPSWCDPMMTLSSSAPGNSPTMLEQVIVRRTDSTTSRTCTRPLSSIFLNRAPSLPLIQTPGIGRSIASYGT
jgi:hypothetical protein